MDDAKVALARIDSYLARTADLLAYANDGKEMPRHLRFDEVEIQRLDEFLDSVAFQCLKTSNPSASVWLAPGRFAYRTDWNNHGPTGWLEAFYRGLTQSKSLFQAFSGQTAGDAPVSTNTYNILIKDVVGPVNVLSQLEDVVQEVRNAPDSSVQNKQALAQLLVDLKDALGAAPADRSDEAEFVTEKAKAVVDEFRRPKPRAGALAIEGAGLVAAANALKSVVPVAVDVAKKIAEFVANPMG